MPLLPGLVAILVIAIGLSVPGAGQIECEADHQCQLDQFCYDKTGYCTQCVNCRTYNRVPSEHQNCAKGVEDCGSCIQGYKEEILSGHEKRDFCTLAPTSTAGPISEKTDSTNNESRLPDWAINVMVAIAIAMIILLVGVVVCYKKHKSKAPVANRTPQSSSEEPLVPPPLPPPYTAIAMPNDPLYSTPLPSSLPSSPKLASAPLFEVVTQNRSYVTRIHQRGENGQQQAAMFKGPQGIYSNSDDDSSETDDQAVGHNLSIITPPSPADLEDQETNPSPWMPGNQGSESNQPAEARATGDNSQATLGDSRVTLGELRAALGDSRVTLGDSRVTLGDSGNSSSASLNDTVGSTAQGTVVPSLTAQLNSLRRRSLSSPEPQNAAKKPRSDSGCSLTSSAAGEEPDATNPPEDPTNNNNSSSVVITNNIFISHSFNI